MKDRVLAIGIGAGLLGAVLGVTSSAVSQPATTQQFTLGIGEGWGSYHAGSDPAPGKRGHVVMFRGPFYVDDAKVGNGYQTCRLSRITETVATFECTGVADLAEGTITFAGLVRFGGGPEIPVAQTVAVTGGTGGYAGATGTITAEEHATDTEYYQDWTFDISLP